MQTRLGDGYNIDFNYLKLHQTLYRGVTKNLFLGLGIFYDHFWNIHEVNIAPNVLTDFQKYGLTKNVTSTGPAFRLLFDSRLNPINPNQGSFANIVVRPNMKWMGSDNAYTAVLVEARTYFHFPARSKNVIALWTYNWFSIGSDKPPYLLLPSTGWDDFFNTGRGYIQGRYRGNDMIYLESEYRFPISHNGILGGVAFLNAETFSRRIPTQLSQMALGAGTGLRIKLNKFSKTNLGIDYGFGAQGSRGVAVNLGEVF